jgi:hypothetical protein
VYRLVEGTFHIWLHRIFWCFISYLFILICFLHCISFHAVTDYWKGTCIWHELSTFGSNAFFVLLIIFYCCVHCTSLQKQNRYMAWNFHILAPLHFS